MLGLSNVPAVLLAEKLVRIAPEGLSRVFYSDSGSTVRGNSAEDSVSVLAAERAAVPEQEAFISLTEAYHGDTIGSVSVGGIDLFHQIYRPLLFTSYKIESPFCYRCPLGRKYPAVCRMACLMQAEKVIREQHRRRGRHS